jgi:hypothetical protein
VLNLNGGNLAGMTLTVVAPVGTQTQGGVHGYGTISGAIDFGAQTITAEGTGLNFTNASLATTFNNGSIVGTIVRNFGYIAGTGTIETIFENRNTGSLVAHGGNLTLTSATPLLNFGSINTRANTVNVLTAWTNQGRVILEGGTVAGGALMNRGTVFGTGVVAPTFQNQSIGVVTVSGGNMTISNPVGVLNQGTMNIFGNVLDVNASAWTNTGRINVVGGTVRTGAGTGVLFNWGIVATGSSIDSDFHNSGTFLLGSHTSITGNFTNAGWTNFGTANLTVLGPEGVANQGNGINTGVFVGSGTLTIDPGASSNASFTNTATNALGDGGAYNTQNMAFTFASGTINVEVTNTDIGEFLNNIPSVGWSWATLTLPNTLTLLRLMDDFVNQGGGTQEAIYVENLHLGSALTASNFDFGLGVGNTASGLKIYYNHIIGDGGVNYVGTYDGAARIIYFGNIIPLQGAIVPEPSTFALLLLGLPLLIWFVWRTRRQQKEKAKASA